MLELSSLLDFCACPTKDEEITELIRIVKENKNACQRFMKLLPLTLKKLASKKNKSIFEQKLKEIYSLQNDFPVEFKKIEGKIKEVEAQAKVRFSS